MFGGLDASQVIVAIISGGISGAISIFALYRTHENNKELEKLKNRLAIEKDDKASRRDYEYDARKRVYKEIAPIIFTFTESCEIAYRRIHLLGTRLNRDLPEFEKVYEDRFSDETRTTLRRTLFELLVPMAAFKIFRNRLTQLDIDLIWIMKFQYEIGKTILNTFYDHKEIAKLKGFELNYEYLHNDKDECKQGISPKSMEKLLDFLIFNEPDGKFRILTLEEFLDKIEDKKKNWDEFTKIFKRLEKFSPTSKPVFWRMLLVQSLLYKSIININRKKYCNCLNNKEEKDSKPKPRIWRITKEPEDSISSLPSKEMYIYETFLCLSKDHINNSDFKNLYREENELQAICQYLKQNLNDL
jgi:hypothetical protein